MAEVVAVVEVAVDRADSPGTTTGATIEATSVNMTATTIGSTVRTGADLRLRTTAEDIVPGLDHGPTRHATTEQQQESAITWILVSMF